MSACRYIATGTLACSPSTAAVAPPHSASCRYAPADQGGCGEAQQTRINSSLLMHAIDDRIVPVPHTSYCKARAPLTARTD